MDDDGSLLVAALPVAHPAHALVGREPRAREPCGQGSGFRVSSFGFRVHGSLVDRSCFGSGARGSGFGVWGLRFGVWGLGFGVWGLGLRVEG